MSVNAELYKHLHGAAATDKSTAGYITVQSRFFVFLLGVLGNPSIAGNPTFAKTV